MFVSLTNWFFFRALCLCLVIVKCWDPWISELVVRTCLLTPVVLSPVIS